MEGLRCWDMEKAKLMTDVIRICVAFLSVFLEMFSETQFKCRLFVVVIAVGVFCLFVLSVPTVTEKS